MLSSTVAQKSRKSAGNTWTIMADYFCLWMSSSSVRPVRSTPTANLNWKSGIGMSMTFCLQLPLIPMLGVLNFGDFSYFRRQSPRKLAKVSASPPPQKLLPPLSSKDATSHGKIGMQKITSPRTWAKPLNT
jgi:hypothetical protein